MRATDVQRRLVRLRSGFATATVLGLVAVIGLLSVGALHDAIFGEQLATSRVLQQRALAVAELGLQGAMARIAADTQARSLSFSLEPLPDATDTARVTIRHVGSSAIANGMSSPAFEAHHFEIVSTGHASKGMQMKLAQGAVRILPVGVAPEGSAP